MGIRETLNQNRGIAIGAISGVIVLAFGYAALSLFNRNGAGGEALGDATPKSFFSDDDGATFFTDDAQKIPPFDHNGRKAVRAYVFTCDGGKTRFVGYLERYTEQARRALDQQAGKPRTGPGEAGPEMLGAAMEIKSPKSGEQGWVMVADPRAITVRTVRCPKDPSHEPEQVRPQ